MSQNDSVREIIERLRIKVEKHGLRCKVVLQEEKGELHVGLYCSPMGKRHKPARATIERCLTRARRLSNYTVYLYLNPRHTGKACITFVHEPKKQGWRPGVSKHLPCEELVA